MADLLNVGSTFAGCRLEAVLGRGGMGIVYLAEQPALGRRVAIKVIAPELAHDPGFRQRFERESKIAAAIEHPNAVPIYEAGIADGDVPYLVMRYVEGTDLRTVISDEGRLEPPRAAGLVAQVAGALDEAHSRGLVHRDVKPANVLISSRKGSEHAYLTDFGLTKQTAETSGLTATGQWVGTVDYVSPEQIEGRRLDARSDVYALGCTLFHALTGRVPFDKETQVAKLYAHATEDPPAPSSLVGGLPAELDAVVARALAKDPEERFTSAGDLGRAAVAAAAGERVTSPERTVAAGEAAPVTRAAPPPTAGRGAATTRAAGAPVEVGGVEATAAAPATDGARRRRRTALVALGVAAAAAIAIALVTGLIGGGDEPRTAVGPASEGGGEAPDGGGGAPGADEPRAGFETLDAGPYTVEVPKAWEVLSVDGPASDPAVRRTELSSPSGAARFAINRRPELAASPAEQAQAAEQDVLGEPGYERLRFEPATIGGRETFLWEFRITDDELGPARATAYFLAEEGGAYRIQTTATEDDPELESDLATARQAAKTLAPA
jgi:hypothetical protein